MNKKNISLVALFFLLSFTKLLAQNLDVFLTINRFYQIETKESYIEIAYLVPFNAVTFKQYDGANFQAKLNARFQIYSKGNLIGEKKYVLQTPKYQRIEDIRSNLNDLVRLKVPEQDTLELKVYIEDLADSIFYQTEAPIYVPIIQEVSISDVMLVSSASKTEKETAFSRNQMQVVPKFMNYYPTEITQIQFYTEFYKQNEPDNFLVRYLITDEEGLYVDGYAAQKKILNKNYEVIIGGFDISTLESGNYYLFVELLNSKNESVQRKRAFFQRSNKSKQVVESVTKPQNELEVIVNNFAKKYDLKNIKHHLMALEPIANTFEKATLESFKNSENVEQMQNYFFSFWKQRNALDPELEWKNYAEKLQFVEREYTTINYRGYETPRGKLYLVYGKPTRKQLYRKKAMGEFWLWNYESIEGQANVNFVFLNQSKITDDFVLVHTNLRNSVFDKNWAEYLKNEL